MKIIFSVCSGALLVSSLCMGQARKENRALPSLVESERTFAKTSVQIGARPAFMKFFADDAMVFRPHPVKYKEAMKNVPMPKNPLEATLNWEPIFADVSASGELGYTTGPSEWIDHSPAKRPAYYGFYFSFWKKQPSGEWKVVFDVGTEIPGRYSESRILRSPAGVKRATTDRATSVEDARSKLMKIDADFLAANGTKSALEAFENFVDPDARFYRQKEYPIVGREAYRKYFSRTPYLSTWKPLGGDGAASGELGYVYGSYEVNGAPETSVNKEKGYYLRAWKKDARNNWKLVAEVLSPLPPEAPKSK